MIDEEKQTDNTASQQSNQTNQAKQTMTSEATAQTMNVKVVNMIGEEIFAEELTEFIGQYTKAIDMTTQPKAVYFLRISNSAGVINTKIVLQ